MDNQRESLWLVVVILGSGFLMMFAFIFVLLISFVGIETDFSTEEGIGIIEIEGVIEDSKKTLSAIREFKDKESVKAVMVRINSPGGAVAPSQEVYNALKDLAEVKPVAASMSSLAASGGYYIACGTPYIFANPGTLTGSIGVIIQSTYLKELMDYIKVHPRTYKSGEHKDILSPFRKATESDKIIISEMIDDVYDQFLEDVAVSRKLDKEILRPMADGRVLTGRQAASLKLVDELGGFNDALSYLADQSGLTVDADLIYPEKEALSYIEKMLESAVPGITKAVHNSQAPAVKYQAIQ